MNNPLASFKKLKRFSLLLIFSILLGYPAQTFAATYQVNESIKTTQAAYVYPNIPYFGGTISSLAVGTIGTIKAGPVTEYGVQWWQASFPNNITGWVNETFTAKSSGGTTVPAQAPAITAQPSNAIVTAPATATFSVSASGTAPLTYQWQKNGANISGATATNYTTPATSSSDSGSSFRVIVSNSAGTVTSSTANLTVNTPPPTNTNPSAIQVGDTIKLLISAPFYNQLSWGGYQGYLGYQPVGSQGIVLIGPTVDDSATWVRVDLNLSTGHVIGWVQVSQISKVSSPSGGSGATAPAILTQPASVVVPTGASATFTVTASGTAPLSYQWQKNGVNISGATAASYTTPATTIADSGSAFKVVVSNSAGTIISNAAALTVNLPSVAPSIVSQPISQTVTAPGVATFTVIASGTGPLIYQWQKNNINIPGATTSGFTTSPTATADSGSTYRVIISNSGGTVTSQSATLTVKVATDTIPPTVPTGLNAAATCNQISLSWNPSTDTSSGVKVYNIFRKGTFLKGILAPNTSTIDISLTASTLYSYTISAVDFAGNESAQSNSVVLNTPSCNFVPTANAGPDGVGEMGKAVGFDGSKSGDPDGSIVSYEWNFGDGSTGSGMFVSHIFSGTGNYTVTLKVTDNSNLSSTDTVVVAISQSQGPASLISVLFPQAGEPEVFTTIFTHCPLFSARTDPRIVRVEFTVDLTKIEQSMMDPTQTYSDGTKLYSAWLADGKYYQFTRSFLNPGAHTLFARGYDQSNKLIAESTRAFLFLNDPDAIVWQTKPVTTESPNFSQDFEESKFLALINNYRRSLGLGELQLSTSLTKAAQGFSDDMAKNNYFPTENHLDRAGKTPLDRVKAQQYPLTYRGENIYSGFCDADSAFNAWKFSAGHDANMRNPLSKEIGIGRSWNPFYEYWYRCLWTTDFGG